MAIEKEKFFEIINEVGESKGLDQDNLLERIKNELKGKDVGEYNKFSKNFSKEHPFSIKISEETAENWTLLHLATACNLLIVKLLLKKKVSVSTRVKNSSKNDGPTALHIAASYGCENIVKQLLSDDRVNPLLKSEGKTPRKVVGNTENKEAIVKMLEEAEKDHLRKKIKDLHIKVEERSCYHLSQNDHMTQSSSAVNGNNATTALGNGKGKSVPIEVQMLNESKKENNDNVQSEQIASNSITGESNNSIVSEQYLRVSVKSMVEKIESPQRRSVTCSGKQTPTGESVSSDDSGLELETTFDTSSCSEINHNGVGNEVDNQILESLPYQIQLRNSRTRELERSDKELKLNWDSKAEKELAELKSYAAGHKTKLEALSKLSEENQSLKQKIKNLENENTTLNSELEKIKTKIDEMLLEKTEKRQLFSKVIYVSLVAMLVVGTTLSIASGLSVLLIIAISVTSALVAGGVTYAIIKPATELTELKKEEPFNNIVCKT
ncbi:Ankyrin repeats (3 copies) [Wolbachia endosymbiont of Cylisticus convexus]|uniref:ankyrin repeat domain-containing protein n=1 Tax=Wolbachia endosymbiont of Cylisticus convexus TaxID=118728 RepID=UPI000DF71A76|nr:ankyrin repeat domain-containing protein [Wolbachia endosymbiont of Cylisticus convexus]RDD35591.1 Ankyrin repeats (3 copies) [Wolbachia endosymbiont of Cylisticus convexus]